MNDLTIVATEDRSVADVSNQVIKIQDLMKSIMKDGEHYGVIPGTGKKPSLLKPGAEKLCFVFRLAPEFEVMKDDLPNGHREFRVICRLRSMGSGGIVGEGVGSCSTMESKYRYRKSWSNDGVSSKVENPDIADVYNTVLKMAKKRAHVDATITACAASDIFTQDVEDMAHEEAPTRAAPKSKPVLKETVAPPTRSKSFQSAVWYAKLTNEEAKKAVFSVCDPFEYGNAVGDVINKIDDAMFGKVLDAVEKFAVNKEAANA